ncbi:polar amino acid transport system permease protein/polar amino acid transport system substrate-binding protein [Alkalibaculum bacchi]|uniref:Polar amino acid transport system permease protein/polar amino acid transport system substrate-binding protein n=1 Tax=Alkalibaculum bacchi TaxID=645887 RepID=A0A366I6D1_9FIRM|nr:amino acid ABC transporter permease [Alkalibaculum bacchi]RBP63328.1 polar amino acid transport system permease protein/polar amino acid transport system substrate-binding protein [Alkalibaculum bacchi]
MNLGKVFGETYELLFQGLQVTIQVTVLSLLIAFVLGLITSLLGFSKTPLRWISKVYVWLIRGTPVMVQVFYIYFALPQLLQSLGYDVRLTSFMAGLITLTLNAGAYMSEIFRGAILAVNSGQMEAARSLGLSKSQAMRKVILPQAIRICLPSLVNQFIITLKDSSIISVIGLADIMYQAKIYVGRSMESFATYTWVAVFYLVIITILTQIAKQVEKKVMI